MSGRGRKDEKEEEGGWASTFWKVAGAAATTAVVAGGLYSVLKQPEAERSSGGGGGVWTPPKVGEQSDDSSSEEEQGEVPVQVNRAQRNRNLPPRLAYYEFEAATAVLKQPEAEVEAGGSSGGGAVWTPPKVGWYKLNVDGSLLREIQSAGCGGVLRNDSGKWIHGFAQKLSGSSKEDETEKEGILKGLQWAKKMGVRKLEVESDNKGIVDKVNDGNKSNDRLIVAIRKLLFSTYWEEATLTWIRNGANGVADELADIARSLTDFDMHEFYSAPNSSCLKALAKDSPHLYSTSIVQS